MNEETRISLEDCFIDVPNMDARKFVFDGIKQACGDGKRSLRNKVTPINQRQENGQMKQIEYSLKGVDFSKYSLDSNTSWLPKNIDKEDNTPIELKLGDNTMKYIKIYGQIVLIRHEQYNMCEDAHHERIKKRMLENNPPPETMKQWEESEKSIRETRLAAIPSCIEEVVYVSIWPLIQQKVEQSDNLLFEKEYQEEYTTDKKPNKK